MQVRYITVALQNSIFNKNSLKRVLSIFMPFVVFPVLLPFPLPFPYQYFCQSKYRVNVYISSWDTHIHIYISSTGKTINCFYSFFGGVVSASLILYWYLKKPKKTQTFKTYSVYQIGSKNWWTKSHSQLNVLSQYPRK